MGDMKKLHEEMRDIHATVQKLEDLPASFHTLNETIAQLTAAVTALVANTPAAPTSTAVTHSTANQATPETAVLTPQNPTPFTRVTRLEFPTFSGKEDPLVWLHRCELFFDRSPLSDPEKVSTAAYYMFDVAQLWFKKRLQDGQQFLKRNSKRLVLSALALLAASTPWTLLARADNILYSQQVNLFTAGLDEVFRIDVERMQPVSLDEAINIARDYARKGLLLPHAPPRQPFPSQTPPSSAITVHQQPQSRTRQKLSPTEMIERQKRGLCYNCDEQWVKGHRCKQQLYMLGFNGDGDDEPNDPPAPD
nr:retrotransposon protein, putative, unclassified [Ipomoea batatas]